MPHSSLRPSQRLAPRCGQYWSITPTWPRESRKASSSSPMTTIFLGSPSTSGSSSDNATGSQKRRSNSPIPVPAPDSVRNLLSSARSIATSRRRSLRNFVLLLCKLGAGGAKGQSESTIPCTPIGLRQAVELEERQLVPIAPLKCDLPINDMEEPASAQSLRVPPFQDGPLAVFEEIFPDANHLGHLEAGLEHRANRLAAMDRTFSHLMVGRVRAIKRCERINIGAIECIDPGGDNLLRRYRSYQPARASRRSCHPQRRDAGPADSWLDVAPALLLTLNHAHDAGGNDLSLRYELDLLVLGLAHVLLRIAAGLERHLRRAQRHRLDPRLHR